MTGRYIDDDNSIKRSHLIIALVFALFIASSLIYGLVTRNPDRSNWIKSIGRVYGASIVRSKWRKVEYWVKGKRHTGFAGACFEGNCIGDVYEILVNPKDYEQIYLLNDRPLFLKGEAVGETVGKLLENAKISTDDNYKEAFPFFVYYVNGKKYKRVQKIEVPLDSSLVLQKDMQFRVRYWLENPQRSILDYNEPR